MNRNLRRLVENHFLHKAEMINHYKRHDVFRCMHESHRHFNHTVSVYHVLKVKQCYPHGCTYFLWKCKKLCIGASCPKKYHHVGRLCFSCRFFYDEKEINRPEIIISQDQFKNFLNEFKLFEDWIDNLSGRQVEFSGTISSVKPEYILMKTDKRTHVILKGFLITFSNCIINRMPFNDTIYAPVSIRLQNNFNFSCQDVIDCSGYFTVSGGMIFLRHLRRIETFEKLMPAYWTESKARVMQKTGTILSYQIERCHACEHGTLLYVFHDGDSTPHSRALFCLEGINDPELCGFPAKQLLMHTTCPHDNFTKL